MAVLSGGIANNTLYSVSGSSITYNAVTVTAGNTFRGVLGVTTFTGSGVVDEVTEYKGEAIEYVQTGEDLAFLSSVTVIAGMAVEFVLNSNETIVNDTTKVYGMAIELIDYPFFAFEIIEIEGD